ncbi:phosphatase PAP2/dual specificity phosphatase family protein [Halomonas sp. DP5N14-9]|uniref:phosphatase PAP2/dual specificity phosphatase family protein n=1 Tax=Halomonas sp. DP5N14-9 TaxID=2859075 RepID=UPI001C990271|nr:phosphatase PAP2/dual specificity phosphatase family protein [Halomonas sp. DP5N14-9]MBY5942174.1 phosphatase PAP2/dual specificity phosphatase family protein [Halomonas sp. DP5N14-9]
MSANSDNRYHACFALRVKGALSLLVLGLIFFASYTACNHLSAAREPLPSMMFAWESAIPLLPWTIVPYWSIDLMYALALLWLPRDGGELSRLVKRLLSVQLLCVIGFLAYPLRCGLVRPELDGVFGSLFDILMGFDLPYNQAPSLHIALLVVLWHAYAAHLDRRWRWLLHGWCGLIGVSVLTTWQHHFIDVPSGALVGALSLWLWPSQARSPLALLASRRSLPSANHQLAWRYALAATALCGLALAIGGAALWLAWPALSLLLVALNYAWLGPSGFQKDATGRLSLAATLLYAPYTLAAWLNARVWTRRRPQPDVVTDGVYLGRLPWHTMPSPTMALVDLCAELPAPSGARDYTSLGVMDLTVASPQTLRLAAETIERYRQEGPVLVCCALGVSRSTSAVAAWLLLTGRAGDVEEAITQVRRARPISVLKAHHRQALGALAGELPSANADTPT